MDTKAPIDAWRIDDNTVRPPAITVQAMDVRRVGLRLRGLQVTHTTIVYARHYERHAIMGYNVHSGSGSSTLAALKVLARIGTRISTDTLSRYLRITRRIL